MNLDSVISECVKSINTTLREFTPTIVLVMKNKKWSKSGVVYLTDRKGPKGNAIQETNDGLWVIFDAVDVLAYCMAISGLNLEQRPDGSMVIDSQKDSKR